MCHASRDRGCHTVTWHSDNGVTVALRPRSACHGACHDDTCPCLCCVGRGDGRVRKEPRSSPALCNRSWWWPAWCQTWHLPHGLDMVCRLPEFNYQIRSGVAHTLQTARDGDDMFENLKPILYAMSSIIFFTTQLISVRVSSKMAWNFL